MMKNKQVAGFVLAAVMAVQSTPAMAECMTNLTVHNTYPDKAVKLGVCLTKAQHVHAWSEDLDCMQQTRWKTIEAGGSLNVPVQVQRTKRTYFQFRMNYFSDFEGGYKTEKRHVADSNNQKCSVSRNFDIYLKPTDKVRKEAP